MLAVTGLRKEFSSVVAVDGVSFKVARGDIMGLLGPNGAGKTTTIRMVLNILRPDAGEITYEGRRFSEYTRNIVGYLPEERGLYRKSKVWDTLMYFAGLRGTDPARAKTEAHRWLQRFGLLGQKDRRIEELSKGNQQKVQFIGAVVHEPLLLVLDEPFSGLDPMNQELFKDVFLELRGQGRAIVFSTHQMDQAEKLSDTLCLINRGRAVLQGNLHDVKRRYGKNSVHLEFDGDGAFLASLPGVRRAMLYPNSAEIELETGVVPQSILSYSLGRIDIRTFQVLEPSLNSIFIQIVGEAGGASAPPPLQGGVPAA